MNIVDKLINILPTNIFFDMKLEDTNITIEAVNLNKDAERLILVFYQTVDLKRYYLGTVRLNNKDKQWYVILDDLSTEFTMEEVMSEFNKQFGEEIKC